MSHGLHRSRATSDLLCTKMNELPQKIANLRDADIIGLVQQQTDCMEFDLWHYYTQRKVAKHKNVIYRGVLSHTHTVTVRRLLSTGNHVDRKSVV